MPARSGGALIACLLALALFAPRTPESVGGSRSVAADMRLLRGDWEAPGAFVIVREPLWQDAVDHILGAIVHPAIVIGGPDSANLDGSFNLGPESPWVRDYGPLQLDAGGQPVWLDARYGPDRETDDSLPRWLGKALSVPVEELPYRLDGGAVASNGRGLCVMTRPSLRGMAPLDEATAGGLIGCPHLVVVPALEGEPTGHADLIVQFLAVDVAAVASLGGGAATAVNRARLDAAAESVGRAAKRVGQPLTIVRVPAHFGADDRFYSYVNVVVTEERLLVPSFVDVPPVVQTEAYSVLAEASGKPLFRVPADAIALAGGGLHCVVLGLYVDRTVADLLDRRPGHPVG